MESIDKENFKRLRKRLPWNYAELLFQRYKQEKLKISKMLIYKVAYGDRNNAKIINDLLQMAEEREAFLKRVSKFERRMRRGRGVNVLVNKCADVPMC